MDGGEHVMKWAGRFISWYSRVGIRARYVCMFHAHTWEITCVGLWV